MNIMLFMICSKEYMVNENRIFFNELCKRILFKQKLLFSFLLESRLSILDACNVQNFLR